MPHEIMSERLPDCLEFPCDVCGRGRPQYLVEITRHDISDQFGLDAGSVERIVRHCGDLRECVDAAEDPDNWRILDIDGNEWSAEDPPEMHCAYSESQLAEAD